MEELLYQIYEMNICTGWQHDLFAAELFIFLRSSPYSDKTNIFIHKITVVSILLED
jgi:hypothetical protein